MLSVRVVVMLVIVALVVIVLIIRVGSLGVVPVAIVVVAVLWMARHDGELLWVLRLARACQINRLLKTGTFQKMFEQPTVFD